MYSDIWVERFRYEMHSVSAKILVLSVCYNFCFLNRRHFTILIRKIELGLKKEGA